MPTFTPRGSRAAVEEVYSDLCPLIRDIAWRFARRYGRDFDETMARANLIFLKAYHSHRPELGRLETRLQFVIHKRLLDEARREAIAAKRMPTVSGLSRCDRDGRQMSLLDAQPAHDPEYTDRQTELNDVLTEISEDGEFVARLMLDPPDALLARYHALKHPTPASERDCLKRYLRECGWERTRIRAALREVKEVSVDDEVNVT